ncbi:MAG: NAD(P)H-dependent oxidoreductase [Betaproteobacteria bacterium]|nr:NAD(P)H-dependent oxidoreductase [Betaproteobacteria bacterium]
MPVRILALAGSARRDSLNKKLVQVAAKAVTAEGAEVTLIDLNDYPMPLYHGDLEAKEGVPVDARRLRRLVADHQGLLIASPENNASVAAVLKNALDWVSRPTDGQNGLAPYHGKVAALLAASPGAYGGLRGLVHLRQILQALGVLVLTEQVAVGRAHELFSREGALTDVKLQASVLGLVRRLVSVTARLAA